MYLVYLISIDLELSRLFNSPTLQTYIYYSWPSKTDSAPVRGDGYEPGSLKFRLRANAETSHSVR